MLKAPEFQTSKEAMTWRYRGERKEREADRSAADFWDNVGAFLAQISQALLWIAAAAGVVGLLLFLRRYLPQFLAESPDRYRPPDALFGLAVTPESLPDDVAGTAAQLAREGRLREALSLLYRGALSVLVHRDHVPLAEGDTEGDCLRAARKALPRDASGYFGRLVRAWQAAAYAGRLPGVAEAEALARDWAPVFAAPRPAAAASGQNDEPPGTLGRSCSSSPCSAARCGSSTTSSASPTGSGPATRAKRDGTASSPPSASSTGWACGCAISRRRSSCASSPPTAR